MTRSIPIFWHWLIQSRSLASRQRTHWQQCMVVAMGLSGWMLIANPVIADMPDGERQSTMPQTQATTNGAARIASQVATPVDELEKQLRSSDFKLRQQAMMQLWSNRELYRSWVEQAVNDRDPEVARRATWILDRWKRGLLPQLPANVMEKLQSSSGPDTVEYLLNFGVFSGAIVAIDEATRSGRGQAMVERAKSALRRRFPFYVRIAEENSELPMLVELVGRLRDDTAFALAYERLTKLVPESIDPQGNQAMPASGDAVARVNQIKLLASIGELQAAIDLAKQSDEPELLRVCQMLAGQWADLMQTQLDAVATEPSGSLEFYRHWMYVLMGAARSDHAEMRDKAIQLLKEPRGQLDADAFDPVNRIRWQSLALHGEVTAAGELLKQYDPTGAAEMLATAERYEEAFAMIQVPLDELESIRSRLVADAVRSERTRISNQDTRSTEELENLLAFCRLLVTIGDDATARRSIQELNANLYSIDDDVRSVTRVEVIQAVTRMNRDEWILDFIVEDLETTLSDRTKFFLAVKLDSEIETIDALLDALSKLDPSRNFADRMRAVTMLLLGRRPEWIHSDSDFDFIFATLASGMSIERMTPALRSRIRSARLSLDIARLFELHSQPTLASQTRQLLAESGDLNAKLAIAELELKSGSVLRAREMFADIWQQADQRGQDTAQINMADNDAAIATKALIGEAIAARRLSDRDEADKLDRLTDIVGCSPSATLQISVAEYLIEKGRLASAADILGPLLRMTAFGSTDDVVFYNVARLFDSAVSKTQPIDAAAALDLAVSGTTETTEFYPSSYISLPVYVHRRLATAGIKQKNEAAVKQQVDALLKLYPVDIDFAEKMLEPMREAGMTSLAQSTLERVYHAGRKHLQSFPHNVGMLNNLAWVMALSDYQLEEAVEYSKRAVQEEPDSTVYRDTLAEILFRLGRKDEAIAIEQACLLDDPAEWHVHQQIERFGTTSPQDKFVRPESD